MCAARVIPESASEVLADGRTLSLPAFSELVGAIYDCAVDPSRWEQTLVKIVRHMDGTCAILSLNDRRRDRLLIDKSVGWGDFGIAERQKHIPEIHARLNEWFATGPSLDDPFIARRQLSHEYLTGSAYVQHCLKPLGIFDLIHLFLMFTPTQFSEVVVGRHERQGAITDRQIGIGFLLLPHLRRAVTISNVLDARAIEGTRLSGALDALSCGVVLTNGEGGIVHANRPAEDMFRTGDTVQGSRGFLSARAPAAAHELKRAIRLAARDEAMLGKSGLAVRLTGLQAPPVFAHVLPLNGSEHRTRLEPEAIAAVFIGPPSVAANGATSAERKDYLRRRYGLTNAESDVALEILKGDGRPAAARRLGITATTVRSHLSRIFEKTGVKRQAELVRLLMDSN